MTALTLGFAALLTPLAFWLAAPRKVKVPARVNVRRNRLK